MSVQQTELALVKRMPFREVPIELIKAQPSLLAAIKLCAQVSGLEEKEIYLALNLEQAQWSRIKSGDMHFPPNKLNDLMDTCGNEAPLIWLANSRGKGLVLLQTEAEKRAEEAERALHLEREKNRVLMEAIQGRK